MSDSKNKKTLLISTFQDGAYAYVIFHVMAKMGWNPLAFNHRSMLAKFGPKYTNEFLMTTVNAIEPDYVLTIKGRGLDPKVIAEIPAKKVLWWFDLVYRYGDFEKYIDVYDKYYVVEEGQGYPWMATGIDPDIHKRIETDDEYYHSDVVFVGTGHRKRTIKISEILSNLPWNAKIWGNNYNPDTPNWIGEAMYWDKCMMAHSNAKISLNAHYIEGLTPNMRAIEVPTTATLMISDTGAGLEQCLDKGKEYVAYDTTLEAKRLIMKYLEDEDERREIGLAGQRKVYKKHLLRDKLEMMFK